MKSGSACTAISPSCRLTSRTSSRGKHNLSLGVQRRELSAEDHRRIAQHALLQVDLQNASRSHFLDRPNPRRRQRHLRQSKIPGHGDLEAIEPSLADVEDDLALQARRRRIELDARLGLGGDLGSGGRRAQPQHEGHRGEAIGLVRPNRQHALLGRRSAAQIRQRAKVDPRDPRALRWSARPRTDCGGWSIGRWQGRRRGP